MSGYIPSFFFQNFQNTDGLPLAGGSLTTYISETSVPKSLYYDMTLQNPCPNPLQFDIAGICPQYFMESGLYSFVLKDAQGNIISTRDNIAGVVSSLDLNSISATSASFKVKIDENDTSPNFLWNKLSASDTIDFTNTGEKIAINVKNAYKIKGTSSDLNPGYLVDKIGDTASIVLSVSAEKLYAEYRGPQYIFHDSPTVSFITSGNDVSASVTNSGKVKISETDTLEFLEDKIQAGSGIVFTQSEDINGKQIHISTTNSTTNYGKVKITSGGSADFLSAKLSAGPGISFSTIDDKLKITNTLASNAYLTSSLGFPQALSISSTANFALLQLDLSAGTWEVGGNVVSTSALNMLGGSNTIIDINFDGYESFVFSAVGNPLGTLSMPIVPKKYILPVDSTVYIVVTLQLASSNVPVWGNIYARQLS